MRWPRLLAIAALVGIVVVAAFWTQRIYRRDHVVERADDGRAVARVVELQLRRAVDLRVMTGRGTAQSIASDSRMGGLLKSSRVIKAPFAVDYFVDLSGLDRGDFRWNEGERVLTVAVPDVRAGPPNVDESRLTIDRTTGVFVTRSAMQSMARDASARAAGLAAREAGSAANMDRARRAGREAIEGLFEGALSAGGLDARVVVRYPTDPVPDAARWDISRSIADIYEGR